MHHRTPELARPGDAGKGARAITVVTVLALLLSAVAWWVFLKDGGKRITAYFSSSVGLYPGSAVRVLGVQVGTVDEVVPEGTQVRLTMTLDEDVPIPSNVRAAVVAPSVVSDRYVQLSPVYAAGAELVEGAVIPRERTATTVELDELYESLNQLTTALGPDGANANGELSELLTVAAANMKGNGQAVNDVIRQLADATRTLSGSRKDMFETVAGLQEFTTMLAVNDEQVTTFIGRIADVSGFLAGERADLAAALRELAGALEQVRSFVSDNRGRIRSNVDKLAELTGVLVEQRASLAEALDVMPNTVSNLYNSYDPKYGVWDSRVNLLEFSPVSLLACNLTPAKGTVTGADGCRQLRPSTDPVKDGAPVLPLPSVDTTYVSQGGGR